MSSKNTTDRSSVELQLFHVFEQILELAVERCEYEPNLTLTGFERGAESVVARVDYRARHDQKLIVVLKGQVDKALLERGRVLYGERVEVARLEQIHDMLEFRARSSSQARQVAHAGGFSVYNEALMQGDRTRVVMSWFEHAKPTKTHPSKIFWRGVLVCLVGTVKSPQHQGFSRRRP